VTDGVCSGPLPPVRWKREAGGGGPLGEDGGGAAEAVFHGGAAAFDEVAGFLDEGAVAGVVADVFDAVVSGESGFFAGATPANWMIDAST
jgi:hypothetical protein